MKRPVLILGFIPRIVVPIARSLQRNGVPVDVANFAGGPRVRSRAIRAFRYLPSPEVHRAEFVEQLCRFIRHGGHDMLIPTDDQMLTAAMENYDDLKDVLYVASPPPRITRLVLNKSATLEIARGCGIRVPKSILISTSAQLSELVGSFPFPWILKPAEKEIWIEEAKCIAFANADELARRFPAAVEFKRPMLLQEYCTGVGVGVEVLLHEGQCFAVFQHRRLKELPYTGGCAVTAVAEHPDPALVQRSLDLLSALKWNGVAMVEFKVNCDDSSAVLMEVNGRYWGSISLPVWAGIDFPLYHWKLVHGERPDIPNTYAVGKRWRWTVGYLYRLYPLLVDSRHSPAARKELAGDFRNLTEDFGPSASDPTFTLSDPVPAIADFLRAVKNIVSDSFRTLLRVLARVVNRD